LIEKGAQPSGRRVALWWPDEGCADSGRNGRQRLFCDCPEKSFDRTFDVRPSRFNDAPAHPLNKIPEDLLEFGFGGDFQELRS
jgi:hypothetical protein